MITKKEHLVRSIMAECEKEGEPVTRKEAEEMAEMELKARGIKNYVKGEEKKERKPREVKLDEEKVELIKSVATYLECRESVGKLFDVTIANPQKEITFTIGDNEYSLSLIKHRKPKN